MPLLDDLFDQPSDLLLVGQIADDDIDLSPQGLDLIVRLLVLGGTLDEDHVGPRTSESQSHVGSDSPSGPGDQGRLVREREERGEVVVGRGHSAMLDRSVCFLETAERGLSACKVIMVEL